MRSLNAHTTMRRHSGGPWEMQACSMFTSVHLPVWKYDREEANSNAQQQQAAWV